MPAQNAASKRQGWTFLLSGDFSGRLETTPENASGRRPSSRLCGSPSAFYSLSGMLFTEIPTQIGPIAAMHFSVFIWEIFGVFWAAKSEKVLTFRLGHWKERESKTLWSIVQCGRSVEISLCRFSLRAQSERPRGKRRELSHVEPLEFFSLSPHAGESSPLISQI